MFISRLLVGFSRYVEVAVFGSAKHSHFNITTEATLGSQVSSVNGVLERGQQHKTNE